jgi:hypothetical protein
MKKKSVYYQFAASKTDFNPKEKEKNMNKFKITLLTASLALAMAFTLSCSSDDDGGEPPLGKTEDGKDVLVYQEGSLDEVLIKVEAPAAIHPDSFGTLIFKNMKEEEIPKVGDVISSYPTANAPHGFLYKALGVSTQDGITAVIVRQATLEEAIKEVEFEGEADFEFNEDGELLRVVQRTYSYSYSDSISKTLRIEAETSYEPTDNFKVGVGTDVVSTMKLKFSMQTKGWKLEATKLTLSQESNVSLFGKMEGNIGDSKEYPLKKGIKLRDITFTIGVGPLGIPVIITNDLRVGFKVGGEAAVGMNAGFSIEGSSEYGFDYNKDRTPQFIQISEKSQKTEFEFDTYLNGKLQMGIFAGLTSRFYGLPPGIDIIAGPAFRFTVDGRPPGTYVFDKGFENSSGDEAKLEFGVAMELGIDMSVLAKDDKGKDVTGPTKTFAEAYITIKELYNKSFLPLFKNTKISETAATEIKGIKITSIIERRLLNYHIQSCGFCIGESADECENGGGIEKDACGPNPVKVGEMRIESSNFDLSNGFKEGKTYFIRPYFKNNFRGVFYDKAIVYPSEKSSSSSDVALSSSSSGGGSSSSGGETTTYSLDGVWETPSGYQITISGSTCVFDVLGPPESPLMIDARDKGYITIGGSYLRNITSTGNLTWSVQISYIQYYTRNPDVAIGEAWDDATISMSADGQTIDIDGFIWTRKQ